MRWQGRAGQLIVVILIALLLRQLAVTRLPVDFDEPVYFQAGQRYAAALRDGDLTRLINDDFHAEHPGLVKLVYAAVFLAFPPTPEISSGGPPDLDIDPVVAQQYAEMGGAARASSMLFGVANVLLVALVNPLAGLFLAVHSYTVKYTAQIYLEALPMLTSTIAVFAYLRARGKANGWLWLSGAALGLTAAGKYIYCVAGVAIAIDMLWRGLTERRLGKQAAVLLGWGGLALLVFYVANPYLWPNPATRLSTASSSTPVSRRASSWSKRAIRSTSRSSGCSLPSPGTRKSSLSGWTRSLPRWAWSVSTRCGATNGTGPARKDGSSSCGGRWALSFCCSGQPNGRSTF